MQELYLRNNNVMTFKISPKHFLIQCHPFGNMWMHLHWLLCNEALCWFDRFPFSGIKGDLLWCFSWWYSVSHNGPDILVALFVSHSLPSLWRSLLNYFKACKSLCSQSTFNTWWVGQRRGSSQTSTNRAGVNMTVWAWAFFVRFFALSSNYLAVFCTTQPTPPSPALPIQAVKLHREVRGQLPNSFPGAGSDVLYNDTAMTLVLGLRNFLLRVPFDLSVRSPIHAARHITKGPPVICNNYRGRLCS